MNIQDVGKEMKCQRKAGKEGMLHSDVDLIV